MSFGSDLKKYAEKQNLAMEKVVRATLLQLMASVIRKTPVDTGRARANWLASTNQIREAVVETLQPNRRGGTVQDVQDAPGNVWYLVNNLPYIRDLEYGSSDQAPQGMVRITAEQIDSALRNAIKQK